MIEAHWSGSYPCLCSGEWTLFIDGKDYTDCIPENLRIEPMDTYGEYQSWHFEDWLETFDNYADGMIKSEWIKHNSCWLNNIPADPEDVYSAFHNEDWRYGSCGGCI